MFDYRVPKTYTTKVMSEKNKSNSLLTRLQPLAVSFVRYLIVGGGGYIIDYTVLASCYELLHLHYLIATAMGFMCGLIFVYIASNKWVFTTRKLKDKKALEFITFTIIGVIGLFLTMLFMWLFTECFGIYVLISKLFTTALVLLWNFGIRKLILY